MKPTLEARIYAEVAGRALAFGHCVTCCDIFNTPKNDGYIHFLREPREARWAITQAFTVDSFRHWKHMMDLAEGVAIERGHDQCDYGVAVIRIADNIHMKLIRHYYSQHSALNGAEAEMTESSVYDMRAWDRPIYLEDHGKVPGTDSFWEYRQKGEYEHIPYDDGYNRRND
jgi:hypothetical protein